MEHLIHDIFVLYALEDIPGYPHGTWVLVLRNGLAEDFNYFLGRYGAAATHTHDYCTIRSVQATERTKRNTINLFADGRLTVRSFKDGAYQDEGDYETRPQSSRKGIGDARTSFNSRISCE